MLTTFDLWSSHKVFTIITLSVSMTPYDNNYFYHYQLSFKIIKNQKQEQLPSYKLDGGDDWPKRKVHLGRGHP